MAKKIYNRLAFGLLGVLLVSSFINFPIGFVSATPTERNGADDFDSWTAGLTPGNPPGSGGFYDFSGSSNCVVSTAKSDTAPNSVIVAVEGQSGLGGCTSEITAYDELCDSPNPVISYSLLYTGTLGASGTNEVLLNQFVNNQLILIWSSSGVRWESQTGGLAVGNYVPGLVPTPDTWYDVTISGFNGNGMQAVITGYGGTFVNNRHCTSAGTANAALSEKFNFVSDTSGGLGLVFYIDNFEIQGIVPQITATNVAVSNLVGFDVEPHDAVVIARTELGENVRTYNPIDLSLAATQNTPDCDLNANIEGVAAYYNQEDVYVTYTNCEAVTGLIDRIAIRDQLLDTPDQPAICSGSGFCDIDFCSEFASCASDIHYDCNPGDLNEPFSAPHGMQNMGRIKFAPWDWSNNAQPSDATPDHATLGWSYFNHNTGRLGTLTITQNNENTDCADDDSVSFTVGSDVTRNGIGFCSLFNPFTNKATIAAGDQGTAAKTLQYTADIEFFSTGPTQNTYYPDATITNPYTSNNPVTSLVDLSCGVERWGVNNSAACGAGNLFLDADGSGSGTAGICYKGVVGLARINVEDAINVYKVYIDADSSNHATWTPITFGNGQTGFISDHCGCASRGTVAVSNDGRWGAYLLDAGSSLTDPLRIVVFNMTSGEAVATAVDTVDALYTKCCWRIILDDTGKTLWAARSGLTASPNQGGRIMKWDLSSATLASNPGTTPIYDGSGTGSFTTAINSPGGLPTNFNEDDDGDTGGGGGDLNDNQNILGIDVDYVAEGLNLERATVLLLIAIMLIIIGFNWIYRWTESVIGGIFGAFLGFILAVAMALVPQWVMIIIALALLIIFGKMVFGGFSGEETS